MYRVSILGVRETETEKERERAKIADRGYKHNGLAGIYEHNVRSSRGVARAENIWLFCRSVKVHRQIPEAALLRSSRAQRSKNRYCARARAQAVSSARAVEPKRPTGTTPDTFSCFNNGDRARILIERKSRTRWRTSRCAVSPDFRPKRTRDLPTSDFPCR